MAGTLARAATLTLTLTLSLSLSLTLTLTLTRSTDTSYLLTVLHGHIAHATLAHFASYMLPLAEWCA